MSLKNLVDRRSLLAGGAALSVATAFPAAAEALPDRFTRFPIWPAQAPGGEGVTVTQIETLRSPGGEPWNTDVSHIATPSLTMIRPARPNGGALLIIPGGGYSRIAIGHEGYPTAKHFAAAGYCCFILLYRMPADGWAAGPDAPLQDAQRAVRVIRSRATSDGFDPARIGVIGFSAGGHLAARLSSEPIATYRFSDDIDTQPLTLMAAALLYPVILTDGPAAHLRSRNELLGATPTPDRIAAFAGNAKVAATTPPTFLAHALDDRGVPVDNSLAMLASLRGARVRSEAHFFERGGHGFGVTLPADGPIPWPDLFTRWARKHALAPRT